MSLVLAYASAAATLLLGGAAMALGLGSGAAPLWGFGGACLLALPGALSHAARLRDGFSNRGLERERILGRGLAILQRLLALGLALAAAGAWQAAPMPPVRGSLELACLSLGAFGLLWRLKQGGAGDQPALQLEARRSRLSVELSALLVLGVGLRLAVPWADVAASLALALRLFLAGQSLARATTVSAASCGGCGGCSCG